MSKFEDAKMRKLSALLKAIYAQAEKELTEKVNSFFANFEKLDAQKKALVEAGKLSERAYQTWRKNKILMAEKYMDLRDTIADTMRHSNELAASYINHELAPIYAHNFNQVGKNVERQVKGYSFDLVNPETVRNLATSKKTLLPYKFVNGRRDVRWNTKRINSQILQGILQGESAQQMANRLMKNIPQMNKESALRNARTAVTSAQNKGRMDAMKELDDDGVIMGKEWIAAHDDRTRDAHLALDGMIVPYNDPFVAEWIDEKGRSHSEQIMYPGDPNADPSMVYNCRCATREVILGFRKKVK